jgi:hypothetical protein
MHLIDRLELLDTLSKLRLEAQLLVTEPVPGNRPARLRRIGFLLCYLAEHLDMLRAPSRARQAAAPVEVRRSAGALAESP